jgi:hypothetical protein
MTLQYVDLATLNFLESETRVDVNVNQDRPYRDLSPRFSAANANLTCVKKETFSKGKRSHSLFVFALSVHKMRRFGMLLMSGKLSQSQATNRKLMLYKERVTSYGTGS